MQPIDVEACPEPPTDSCSVQCCDAFFYFFIFVSLIYAYPFADKCTLCE